MDKEIKYNGNNWNDILKSKKQTKIFFKCTECGKELSKQKRSIKTKEDLLCKSCKIKHTFKKKYGVENVFQLDEVKEKIKKSKEGNYTNIVKKSKQTRKERYGNENYNNFEKIKQTKKERYGNENYNNFEKNEQTVFNKYGVENVFQLDEVKEKIKQTHDERYGGYYTTTKRFKEEVGKYKKDKTFLNKISNLSNITPMFDIEDYNGVKDRYKWNCNKCDNTFFGNLDKGRIPICRKCNPILNKTSKPEIEIAEYINLLGFYTDMNNRKLIYPYEIDILIHEKNIGIEYNGLYWHSQQVLNESNRDGKKHHLMKTDLANEKGVRLIHIFEDEWLYKNEIVKSRLKSILGKNEYRIGGREINEIKEISPKTKNDFLNKYHIQGQDNASVKIGAFKDSTLVSVMTFVKPRISLGQKKRENGHWELSRFVSISNTQTPGVASKLFKYFINQYNPITIYTYSDIRWNTGNLYEQLGMKYIGKSESNYWYIESDRTRSHRFKYRKQMLKEKLENFNPDLTEYENMLYHGYDRVWDCGNSKWEWRRNK